MKCWGSILQVDGRPCIFGWEII